MCTSKHKPRCRYPSLRKHGEQACGVEAATIVRGIRGSILAIVQLPVLLGQGARWQRLAFMIRAYSSISRASQVHLKVP